MSSGAPTRDKLCRTRIKRSKTGGLHARWHLDGFRSCRSYLCSIAPSTGSRATSQGTAGIQRSDIADSNNLSLMAFSTESACSTEQ